MKIVISDSQWRDFESHHVNKNQSGSRCDRKHEPNYREAHTTIKQRRAGSVLQFRQVLQIPKQRGTSTKHKKQLSSR
jgi:hypothetical protein